MMDIRKRRVRRCRRLKRNNGLWQTVKSLYDDERFKLTFRLSRQTFNYLPHKLEPFILKQNTGKGSIHPGTISNHFIQNTHFFQQKYTDETQKKNC